MKTVLFILLLSACFASNAATLNLNLIISCYYLGSGQMNPVMLNEGVTNATPSETDTIIVELHDTISPYSVAASFKGILMVDGTISCTFSNSVIGNAYYIGVRHRMAIETWSAAPVVMSATTSYDFTSAQTQAYGNYMVIVDTGPDRWGFYCGDINQDGNIDQIDWPPFDIAVNNNLFGYLATDLNGDGNVDVLDFNYIHNDCEGIYSHHP